MRRLVSSVAAIVLTGVAGEVRADSSFVTVGPGWGVVCQARTLQFSGKPETLVLGGIPSEAELASLVLHSRRVPVNVLQWERDVPVATLPANPALRVEGSDVILDPSGHPPSARVSDQSASDVRCLVQSAPGRRKVISSYVVKGMQWEAEYVITIRGELLQESTPLGVDIDGVARLFNPSGQAIDHAAIRLVGYEQQRALPHDPPGFLDLDPFSPMADLWRPALLARDAEYSYDLEKKSRLDAGNWTEVSLIRQTRLPAESVRLLSSDAVPLEYTPGTPLQKQIVFRAPNRGGLALPPGRAHVFLGGGRGHLLQGGRLPRTLPDEEIRVDLGVDQDVLGVRRLLSRSESTEGFLVESFEVAVLNRHPRAVEVEVDEKPPSKLSWSLMASNQEPITEAQRLRFRLSVPAGSEKRLYYKLRIDQPAL